MEGKDTVKHQNRTLLKIFVCVMSLLFLASAISAQEQETAQLKVKTITEHISVIWDLKNGNTLVFAGKDGVLVVDTKSVELAEALLGKISKISKQPIRFVVNTHWHFDHVAGNEAFGNTGATIIAHKNVRQRMSTTQNIEIFNMTYPPAPQMALPVLTFTEDLVVHMNGEDVKLFHIAPGHTDGDGILYFPKANVIHVGDLYFNGLYPYIGVPTGGSINGMISVGRRLLDMIDDNTTIIPGHGPLATKTEYAEFIGMLTDIRDTIKQQIADGKSKEAVIASKPTQPFDEKWGNGFLKPNDFVGLVYMDLARQ